MTHDLIAKALDVNQANINLGIAEVFEAERATFVRDRRWPDIRDANHVTDVRASTPEEIDSLLARAEREFTGFPHRAYFVDYRTPPAFESRLALEGYTQNAALVMLLEGELRSDTKQFEIRPVETDADWAAFGELQLLDWREYRERDGLETEEEVGRRMGETHRIKSPPRRYWLGCIDGTPRGYFTSWEGTEGVGQVEDLFVQKEFRRRGLATALIHHCVADSRAYGCGPVVIVADPTDTPKQMYATMGFRPVALKRQWRIGAG